jgi:hypothetical protein
MALGLLEVMPSGVTTLVDQFRPPQASILDLAREWGLRPYTAPYLFSPAVGAANDKVAGASRGSLEGESGFAEFERPFHACDAGPEGLIRVILGPACRRFGRPRPAPPRRFGGTRAPPPDDDPSRPEPGRGRSRRETAGHGWHGLHGIGWAVAGRRDLRVWRASHRRRIAAGARGSHRQLRQRLPARRQGAELRALPARRRAQRHRHGRRAHGFLRPDARHGLCVEAGLWGGRRGNRSRFAAGGDRRCRNPAPAGSRPHRKGCDG